MTLAFVTQSVIVDCFQSSIFSTLVVFLPVVADEPCISGIHIEVCANTIENKRLWFSHLQVRARINHVEVL